MDRTERFYKINLLLQNRGCVSFDALLQPTTMQYSVSRLRRAAAA